MRGFYRANVVVAAASVHVFLLQTLNFIVEIRKLLHETHRPQIVEVFRDVAGAAPFGARENSAEKRERISR